MQFAVSREGETLSRLTRRLFGDATAAQQRKIVELLRDANPGLGPNEIPAGTIVIVPQVEGVEPSPDVRTDRQIAAALVRNVREQIGDVGPLLDELVERQAQQAQETLDLTKSRDVRNLSKQHEVVRDRVQKAAEDADARLKRNKALRTVVAKADAEIKSDLDDLLEALDPPGNARRDSKRVRRKK